MDVLSAKQAKRRHLQPLGDLSGKGPQGGREVPPRSGNDRDSPGPNPTPAVENYCLPRVTPRVTPASRAFRAKPGSNPVRDGNPALRHGGYAPVQSTASCKLSLASAPPAPPKPPHSPHIRQPLQGPVPAGRLRKSPK